MHGPFISRKYDRKKRNVQVLTALNQNKHILQEERVLSVNLLSRSVVSSGHELQAAIQI